MDNKNNTQNPISNKEKSIFFKQINVPKLSFLKKSIIVIFSVLVGFFTTSHLFNIYQTALNFDLLTPLIYLMVGVFSVFVYFHIFKTLIPLLPKLIKYIFYTCALLSIIYFVFRNIFLT